MAKQVEGAKKVCLGLKWTNHMLVHRSGNKKTVRDWSYSELIYSDKLLHTIMRLVHKQYERGSDEAEKAFSEYWCDVKDAKKCRSGQRVERTICNAEGRKLFTYSITHLKVQFKLDDDTEYKIKENGKIERVSGLCPNVKEPVKTDKPESKPKPASKPKGKQAKPSIKKAMSALTSATKPPSEGKEKKPDKAEDKKELITPCAHTMEDNPQKDAMQANKDGKSKQVLTLSKKQLKECEKFKVDPLALPTNKPKGFNNKIWKAIQK